jgi:hypothetical protein
MAWEPTLALLPSRSLPSRLPLPARRDRLGGPLVPEQPQIPPWTLPGIRAGRQQPAAVQLGAARLGAAAVGAAAVGAGAVGALAIGRLALGRAVIRHLKIEHLEVNRLHVHELQVDRQPTLEPA